jgi:hypothetical protein
MPLVYDGEGLGDEVPNFVSLDNNPDQSAPWLTDYAAPAPTSTITFGPMKIKAAKPKAKTSTALTTSKPAAGKVAIKRKGTAGSILDRILPLMVDTAGRQTIFGVPPVLVYVGAGILSASLLTLLLRLLRGGAGRVSNPKRARAARRAQR